MTSAAEWLTWLGGGFVVLGILMFAAGIPLVIVRVWGRRTKR